MTLADAAEVMPEKSSLYYGWPNILKGNRTLNCKLNGGRYYQ